jgi:hypothetical protein
MCHYQPQAKLQILSRSKPNTRIYMHSVTVNTYPDENLLQWKVILFEKRQSSFMGFCETAHTSAPSIGNPLYNSVMDEQLLGNLSCKPSDFHTLLPMQQPVLGGSLFVWKCKTSVFNMSFQTCRGC